MARQYAPLKQKTTAPAANLSVSTAPGILQRSPSNRGLATLFRMAKKDDDLCPQCESKLHRKAGPGHDPQEVPPIVYDVLRSPGQPLDDGLRTDMERRFGGADFSAVRIHTDSRAAESAEAVNAKAYTVGQHIAFAQSEFAPTSHQGTTLLAHELSHVVQTKGLPTPQGAYLRLGSTNDASEQSANRTAYAVAHSSAQGPQQSSTESSPIGADHGQPSVRRQVAEGLMAAGAGLLTADAEMAPAEAAAGPPGWLLAAGLGIVGAGLLGAGYLLSRRGWNCVASCNLFGTEPHCNNRRVTGQGSGPSEEMACREAKRAATQSAPRGCYARHCQCACTH